jgi:hypothetical protein
MGNVLGQGAFGTTYMAHWRGAQVGTSSTSKAALSYCSAQTLHTQASTNTSYLLQHDSSDSCYTMLGCAHLSGSLLDTSITHDATVVHLSASSKRVLQAAAHVFQSSSAVGVVCASL